MDNNYLFTEEEWEDIQKILDENKRALKIFYDMIDKISKEEK